MQIINNRVDWAVRAAVQHMAMAGHVVIVEEILLFSIDGLL
jgi:hypothetical protein